MADCSIIILIKRSRFAQDSVLNTQINNIARLADTFVIHDIELSRAEWRRNFVLNNFDARAVTADLIAVLNLPNPANVCSHRCIKLKRITASSCLGVAKHHADFHADLINKDYCSLRLVNNTS